MRRCRSSLATRVSPIAGSTTARSLDIESLGALRAEDARLEDGADAAAEVEGGAAAGQPRDLLGEAGGAGDGAAGDIVGEPLEDEAAEGRMQLGEAPLRDRPLPRPKLGVDERAQQLGLLAQQRRRLQHVLLRGGVDPLQGRDELAADQGALVLAFLVGEIVAPGEAALFAVGGG